MKKINILILCLILAGAAIIGLAQPAAADGAAYMSIQSSAGTLYRGDSFTLTVSLSNDQPVSNGGIMLSYDSAYLEFLGGSCNVSNAALAEVSTANGGGVFVMQTDTVVSGVIFTLNMRVRENAAFGSYQISGTPSLSIPCGIGGTSVTVACKHNYAGCTKVDGATHQSTCTICGEKKTDAHIWNGGQVTKAPTCKDTGVKKLTCTACGATKEETVAVNNDHKYGGWSSSGASGHSHVCSVCNKKETTAHTWNGGKVLEQATCTETGVKQLTCTACNETKKETISVAPHPYGESTYTDEKGHTHVCKDCGLETKEDHDYGETWLHDENWHFMRCQACGHEKGQAAHEPGPKATETTDQICLVCNRILQPMGEHVHTFQEEWSMDGTGHWYACTDCNEKNNAGVHVFRDGCDNDCNVCGWEREPLHEAEETWSMDGESHWYPCKNCGEQLSVAAHIPGDPATISSAQLCTVCQYELAPVVPHDHVYDGEGTLHYHRCVCGEEMTAERKTCPVCKTFPWMYVCIGEAVIFAGVLIFLFLRKKKATVNVKPEETEQVISSEAEMQKEEPASMEGETKGEEPAPAEAEKQTEETTP